MGKGNMGLAVRAWALAAWGGLMVGGPAWAEIAFDGIPKTIPEIVLPAPDMRRYAPAVEQDPGLRSLLEDEGPRTALVPLDVPAPGRMDGAPVWPERAEEAARLARALILEGRWTPEDLGRVADAGAGQGRLWTEQGASLLAMRAADGGIILVDRDGNTARVVLPFRPAGNGGVIALDAPILPR